MRMIVGRVGLEKDGFDFNLDNARPMGPQHIIRAAKDPIARVPTDPLIVALLERTLCRAKIDDANELWEITGVNDDQGRLALGAPMFMWTELCEKLLQQAMEAKSE